MKGKYLFFVLFLHFLVVKSGFVFSQTEVTGFVKDKRTAEPLTGANIYLTDLHKGTSSDGRGYFKFSGINAKSFRIKVTYVGYRDTTLQVNAEKENHLSIFLEPDSVRIESIVVTATRTPEPANEIPQSISIIDQKSIDDYPATNVDDLLKMVPGINVNRSWGIFSHNASVTMRGMPGSERNLILLDGVPLNKSAGGTVSWHLVTPEEIDRIEVVKGPGSALYGNNAMGGVINIITKHPQKKLEGSVDLSYGTYNTMKSQISLSGNDLHDARGLYWKIGGFYRKGDGYILDPPELQSPYETDAYLFEGNTSGMLGYQFFPGSKLEIDYRFYKDKRGTGIKVYEKDGSYESFTNNNFRAEYESPIGRYKIDAKIFYMNEFYYRQNENVNATGEYKLVDTKTDKDDFGLWLSVSRQIGQKQQLTGGIDIKKGNIDNHDIYRTSTDDLFTHGDLLFSALFFQDDIKLIGGKLNIIGGLRFDNARFYNGLLKVINPTSQTGFPLPEKDNFHDNSWTELSPKIALKYFILPSLSTYVNAATGFMPPRIDDLAGSRKIRRGFKIANPDLVPEKLISYEWGMNWMVKEKFSLSPSLFYSRGRDFQYLVATGDYIGGDDPVAVYQRQNVSKVEVTGVELAASYTLTPHIRFNLSYAYNTSKILDYKSLDNTDLTGKELSEVPANLVYLGATWNNRFVKVFVDYTFTDKQWYDEENTEIINGYSLFNVRVSRPIFKNFRATLDIQDIFDVRFIDRKGYLSPGRFITFEVTFLINR